MNIQSEYFLKEDFVMDVLAIQLIKQHLSFLKQHTHAHAHTRTHAHTYYTEKWYG